VRYNIHGTETGRLSANDGLHGIPRANRDQWGAAIRGAFITPVGYKIGKCDYAQAELRVFAAISNETFLLDMFANKEDPHGNITLSYLAMIRALVV
jgi:DNA polymerase-1